MRRVTNVLAHGVDVVKLPRFEAMLQRHGDGRPVLSSPFVGRFSKRILHETHEIPRFNQLVANNDFTAGVRFLAGNWAMKEAIYKTLEPEYQKSFQFNQWYKVYDDRGKPQIGSDDYGESDEEFAMSLSHDQDVLLASVIRQQVMYITN